VAVTDLLAGAGARRAGEGDLGEGNPERWARAETTVSDWWGHKGARAHG
jgi:hypothetical protein